MCKKIVRGAKRGKPLLLRSLRLRLTAMFACLTALVLAGALMITFAITRTQYLQNMQTLFSSDLSVVADKLKNGGGVSDLWLAEREAASLSLISITDNGVPLHFTGGWTPPTPRDVLLRSALNACAESGLDFNEPHSAEKNINFSIAGTANERYQGKALYLPRPAADGTAKYIGVIVLQDISAMRRHIALTAIQHLLLWLCGTLALWVISWQLAGRALRPTAAAMRQQNEFVAAASHELRGPLAVMKASLCAVQNPHTAPERAQHFLHTVELETNRMQRLTDDLLLLAGGDAGAWELQTKPLAVDTFCIELYEIFHLVAQEKGHLLTLVLPDAPLPCIQGDAQRLTQLFGVLLGNAIEYAPAGTPIEILACTKARGVAIAVQDHGNGIADTEKNRVFTRFYRAAKSRDGKAHFGLGLSLARELATMHGGTLTLRDTPGGGATLTAWLPAIAK